MSCHSTPPVVIAAGGLGTRVAAWSAFLPKEFRPVQGRPAIVHALEEAAASGARRAVVVHHPYYAPLVTWLRHVMAPATMTQYQELTRQPIGPRLAIKSLQVDYIPQHGRYADVTSALNGAEHFGTGHVLVLFADNVDPSQTSLRTLTDAATPGVPAVLARPFDPALASTHGVIICPGDGPVRTMRDLVEKPSPAAAAELVDTYGADGLRLLLGRLLLTPDVVARMARAHAALHEPKLSLELAACARERRVDVMTTRAAVVDVGSAHDVPVAA